MSSSMNSGKLWGWSDPHVITLTARTSNNNLLILITQSLCLASEGFVVMTPHTLVSVLSIAELCVNNAWNSSIVHTMLTISSRYDCNMDNRIDKIREGNCVSIIGPWFNDMKYPSPAQPLITQWHPYHARELDLLMRNLISRDNK
jgi:hypothetical protein